MGKRGTFIVIEGLDGAGKSTVVRHLVSVLRRSGLKVLSTTEPSNSNIGRLLRDRILPERKVSAAVEALLFAADRHQHLEAEVKPALRKGFIVISDRYVFASLAYQGAQGLDLNWIRFVNRFALKPDLAICLDLPPEMAIKRIRRKRTVLEELLLLRKVREVYRRLSRSGEMTLIDASKPQEEVSKHVLRIALNHLIERGFIEARRLR